jgi:hypothetical protein
MPKSRFTLILALAGACPGLTGAEVPPLPAIAPVPSTGQAPLSSAYRPGNEYADLDQAGYTEKEFYISGIAPAITSTGESLFDVPYISRILVRYPKDPTRFNGTAIIEPFSWLGERGTAWVLSKSYLLRKGYAYVGYTLSFNKPRVDPKTAGWPPGSVPANLNLDYMRGFDYPRYALLGLYFDPNRFRRGSHADPFAPQAQGIGAQLAHLLKSNAATSPLHGLTVQRVYVDSWAVQAQVWMDYLNQGRHQQWRMPDGRALIDAYMTGKMDFGELGGDTARIPRHMPEDAPFVMVYSQSELMLDVLNGIAAPPDSDHPGMRYYELAGVPHTNNNDTGTDETNDLDPGKQHEVVCQHMYDDEPQEVLAQALLDGLDRWVREGKAMPRAPRVLRKDKGLVRDPKTNNVDGGVRPPWIAVPAAAYMTDPETGCGEAYDTKIPYPADELRALYGTYDNYVRQFAAAKQASIKEGYLLPEDADRVKPIAQPGDFVSDGGGAR